MCRMYVLFPLIVSALIFALPLSPLSLDAGIKAPISFNMGFTAAGFRPGTGGGAVASLDLRFLEGALLPASALSVELTCGMQYERHFLSSDYYAAGSYIALWNMRYGGSMKFWMNELYAGAGAAAVYTVAGEAGDASSHASIPPNMYGNRISFSITAGWAMPLIPDLLMVPLEAKLHYTPAALSAPFEFTASAGIIFRFLFLTGEIEQRSFKLKQRDKEVQIINSGRALIGSKKFSEAVRRFSAIPATSAFYHEAAASIERVSNEAMQYYRPAAILSSAKDLIKAKRTDETRAVIEEALYWYPASTELREVLTILKSTNMTILESTNR